ncbi:MAG TPA: SGNH/GDSL hydrolase family protein [Thermoanaerobaculia bacterium]
MKSMLFRAAVSAGVLTALAASPLFSQTTFHKFVGVGDSLVAGEEGNCLVERHQNRSWVKQVANQLGISDFQQPLISEKALSNPLTGQPCLGAVISGQTITVGAVSQMGTNQNAALSRPYDNLGFIGSPRIKDFVDLKVSVPGRSGTDNIAAVILRNFAGGPFEGRSAVDEANSLNPDLVGLWAGNNDVLGAATSAVAIDGVTLTPVAAFEAKYTEVLTGLAASGRTIVTFTIPDVAAIPFETTIPPAGLLGPRTTATCSTPPCPLPAGTLVTLPASSLLAQKIGIPVEAGGTGLPLPDGGFTPPSTLNPGVLLYPDEVALIQQRTIDLNAKIRSISAANGAILIDVYTLFNEIKANGYEIGGITLTTSFLTGGLFSADGVHPSQMGYAIIADGVIQALNAAKGSHIERPDLAQALLTPNVPTISTAAQVDPSGGPYGFSLSMWKELLDSFGPEEGISVVFPAPAKRAKRLLGR